MATTKAQSTWSCVAWFALIWAASVAAMITVSAAIRFWLV
ncbi:MAG: DUF2474 domain-containing protein [Rhodospirillaceae bacterium]